MVTPRRPARGPILHFSGCAPASVHPTLSPKPCAIGRAPPLVGSTDRGDGNQQADPAISFDRVIGYVPKIGGRLAKVPYLGNLGILLGPVFGGKTSDGGALGQPVFEGEPGGQLQPPRTEPEGLPSPPRN